MVALTFVHIFFGGLSVASKVAFEAMSPLALIAVRMVFVVLILWSLELLFIRRPVAASHLPRLAFYSLFGVVGNQLFFMFGVERTDPVAATVLVAAIPAFTLLVAMVLRVERPGPRKLTGAALAFAGVLVVVGPTRALFAEQHAIGSIFVAVNSLFYATYLVLARDILRVYPPITIAAWTFTFGSILLVPLGARDLFAVDLVRLDPGVLLAVGYLIVFGTVMTYVLNNWAMRRVVASTAALFVYIQPLVAAAAAYLVFGTVPALRTVAGAVLILTGVAFAAVSRVSWRLPFGRVRV